MKMTGVLASLPAGRQAMSVKCREIASLHSQRQKN